MRADLTVLGDAVIVAVKGYVGKAVASLSARVDEFDRRLKAIPAPAKGDPGKDADPAVILAMVKEAVAGIPKPADGKAYDPDELRAAVADAVAEQIKSLPPAAPGRDADPAVIAKMVADAVAKQIKELPPATPGRDADPAVVAKMVADAVAALPKPEKGEDGKSVDLVELSTQIIAAAAKVVEALPKPEADPVMVEAAVQRVLESLPKPTNGKDADAAAITTEVLVQVSKLIEAMPLPENGKDADPELMRQAVAAEVARAVEALPKPKDGDHGKSVDLVELSGQIVAAAAAAVKAMPVPKDGENYDPEVLEAAVKRAVDLIPQPEPGKPGEPGKSVTVEDVAPLVAAEVQRVAEAFKPQKGDPGLDADPLLIALEVKTQLATAVQGLPTPAPGKDADPEVLRAAVESAVAEQIKTLPPATPGKDADPELMAREIATRVDAVVKALPPAEPGKDADAEAIAGAVLEKVLKVLDEIPPPAPGKDADPAEIARMVEAKFADMPKPKDYDPDVMRAAVKFEVGKAIGQVQAPPAAEIDPEVLRAEIAKQVADIEVPAPTVDPALIRAECERAAQALPKPRDGDSVPVEQVERMVADAVAKAIADIKLPKDGDPGRDALAIELLPAIDESKSYPRGTFAIHNGGTWHSFERTNGMRGWECTSDGLAELGFEQNGEDPRLITIKGTMSSGKTVVATMHFPVVIDKEVFREGQTYLKGDGVTWGGKFWIARRDTAAKPDSTGGDWRRSVNSGRDGASAFDIARRNGFAGTESEWLASLRASKSVPGA